MPESNFKYLFALAILMFLAKPFVGFNLRARHYFQHNHHRPSILVKSFTKRKLEYSDSSELNPAVIQKRLGDPALPLSLLFVFALAGILPVVLRQLTSITRGFLSALHYSLYPPEQLYLRSGKLTI